MKSNYLLYLSLLILPALALASPERDPFKPFLVDPSTQKAAQADSLSNLEVSPLTSRPLSNYRVIGLIVAPHDSIVLIRNREKREFFATVGDQIGKEGGVISAVTTEGITVDVNGKLIDLTVNNRFDTQNEIE